VNPALRAVVDGAQQPFLTFFNDFQRETKESLAEEFGALIRSGPYVGNRTAHKGICTHGISLTQAESGSLVL